MELEVERYLLVLDREWKWVLERGEWVFGVVGEGGSAELDGWEGDVDGDGGRVVRLWVD